MGRCYKRLVPVGVANLMIDIGVFFTGTVLSAVGLGGGPLRVAICMVVSFGLAQRYVKVGWSILKPVFMGLHELLVYRWVIHLSLVSDSWRRQC